MLSLLSLGRLYILWLGQAESISLDHEFVGAAVLNSEESGEGGGEEIKKASVETRDHGSPCSPPNTYLSVYFQLNLMLFAFLSKF